MSFLLSKIESMHWAITPEAGEAIWRLASREWTSADYEVFHSATKDYKLAIASNLGEPFGESGVAFVNGTTGILMIDGPIIPRADSLSAMSGMVSIDSLTEAFKAFEDDQSIERILMLHDSPGGDVNGVSEFSQLIAASGKRTISYAYGQAASADYWLAAAADEFYAADTAILGSIGILLMARKSGTDNDLVIIKSEQSPDKNPDLTTEKGRANGQQVVNDLAGIFIGSVAKNMNTTAKKVESDFGKGGVHVAARALSAGMIDKVSTLDKLMSSFDEPKTADVTDRGG